MQINRAKVKRERKCGEEQICDQARCINFPWAGGEHAAHNYTIHGIQSVPMLLNTLLQPLPGSQTQIVLWKTLDFIPHAVSPSGSS